MKKLMTILVIFGLVAFLPSVVAETTPQAQQGTAVTANPAVAELEAKGDALRKQKDFQGAIQAYRTGLKSDRKNAVLFNKVGLAELQLGDFRMAQGDFEKAVKYNRNYASAWNNLGVASHAQKRFDTAVKHYKKALALKETDPVFHANLGNSWFAMNKLDRATVEFSRALELDPNVFERLTQGGITARISSPEERARFAYTLAKLHASRGDVEHALESLKKAKEEGYRVTDVYRDAEFASLRQDPRLTALIPPPAVNK